jgi:hypothetical protein
MSVTSFAVYRNNSYRINRSGFKTPVPTDCGAGFSAI